MHAAYQAVAYIKSGDAWLDEIPTGVRINGAHQTERCGKLPIIKTAQLRLIAELIKIAGGHNHAGSYRKSNTP